jgi:hypothetical protein
VKSANQVQFCKPEARSRDRIDEIAAITTRPEEAGMLRVVRNLMDSEGGSLRGQANGATKGLTSQVSVGRVQPLEAENRTSGAREDQHGARTHGTDQEAIEAQLCGS